MRSSFHYELVSKGKRVPSGNIAELHSALAKTREALFYSDEMKHGHNHRYYEKKFSDFFESLSAMENAYTLMSQVRKEMNSTKQVLVTTKGLRDIFDAKVTVSCEIEKRLCIMKYTFAAFGNIGRHVVVKGALVTAIVSVLWWYFL
ncbi:hypothetical protein TRVL_08699 [Trypanosoma vivax]|nr:hypothetical protein TRVL_08699 [Trypanosoma vivax]